MTKHTFSNLSRRRFLGAGAAAAAGGQLGLLGAAPRPGARSPEAAEAR